MIGDYLLYTITNLRRNEEVYLFNNVIEVNDKDEMSVLSFLMEEYERECLNYPFKAPVFSPEAALWAAKLVYYSSQLLLFRKDQPQNIQELIYDYSSPKRLSEILSADLCLRFIPSLIRELKNIDPDDELIITLEKIIYTWPYSAIECIDENQEIILDINYDDNILKQLFANRIIRHKNKSLARHPYFRTAVESSMGNYVQTFWPQYELIITDNNEKH